MFDHVIVYDHACVLALLAGGWVAGKDVGIPENGSHASLLVSYWKKLLARLLTGMTPVGGICTVIKSVKSQGTLRGMMV
jgi:hypothetical protein